MKFITDSLKGATLLALGLSLPTFAAQTVITDDGREVLLKDNGTWEFRSQDRFATSGDGSRIRLKDNGQWERMSQAPSRPVAAPAISQQSIPVVGPATSSRPTAVATASPVNVNLLRVENHVYQEKRQKNSRYDARTVFVVSVNVPANGGSVAPKFNRFNLFEVEDSRGKDYQVLSVSPQPDVIQAGSTLKFNVTVDGTPTGILAFGANAIELRIDRSVFNTPQDLEFRAKVAKMVERKRDTPFDE